MAILGGFLATIGAWVLYLGIAFVVSHVGEWRRKAVLYDYDKERTP